MENKLKKQIEEALGIPVLCECDTLMPPCVTLDIYEEFPVIFGDGIPERYAYSIQVIIWAYSKKERQQLKEGLRLMIERNYLPPAISYGTDPDTRLYQAIFDFQAWKERKNYEK